MLALHWTTCSRHAFYHLNAAIYARCCADCVTQTCTSPSVPVVRQETDVLYVCVQTLQNANSLGSQAGTSSVISSALDSYPNVKACQATAATTATSTPSTGTAGR